MPDLWTKQVPVDAVCDWKTLNSCFLGSFKTCLTGSPFFKISRHSLILRHFFLYQYMHASCESNLCRCWALLRKKWRHHGTLSLCEDHFENVWRPLVRPYTFSLLLIIFWGDSVFLKKEGNFSLFLIFFLFLYVNYIYILFLGLHRDCVWIKISQNK